MARVGEKRDGHIVVVKEMEGNRLLERPRREWGNNIKMMCKKCDRETWARHLA